MTRQHKKGVFMAFYSHRRQVKQETGEDGFWSGFVDMLSTLVLVIIFLLLIFVISQTYLQQLFNDRDQALSQASEKLNLLTQELALTKKNYTLKQEEERKAKQELASVANKKDYLEGTIQNYEQQIAQLNKQADDIYRYLEKIAQVLKLDTNNPQDTRQAKMEHILDKVNVALVQEVEELSRYRSEFFGRLRDILGDTPNIEIVGDRFVFQSEVLFDSASAELGMQGKEQLKKLANVLHTTMKQIPQDIPWVLRVDGHTDKQPLAPSQKFASNWELSQARALEVVKFLIQEGIPPERLAPTGFGEFHPVDPRNTAAAFQKNRRIEIKLTEK